jgi:hypothetical protein
MDVDALIRSTENLSLQETGDEGWRRIVKFLASINEKAHSIDGAGARVILDTPVSDRILRAHCVSYRRQVTLREFLPRDVLTVPEAYAIFIQHRNDPELLTDRPKLNEARALLADLCQKILNYPFS